MTRLPPAPRTGDLLLRLAEALEALSAAPSRPRNGTAHESVSSSAAILTTALVTQQEEVGAGAGGGAAVTAGAGAVPAASNSDIPSAAAMEVDGQVADGDDAVSGDGGGGGDASSGGPGSVPEASPMEELSLEPPALAAAAVVDELVSAAGVEGSKAVEAATAVGEALPAMMEMEQEEGDGEEGEEVEEERGSGEPERGGDAAAASCDTAVGVSVEEHLDLVLEALVRVRGIVMAHSRYSNAYV